MTWVRFMSPIQILGPPACASNPLLLMPEDDLTSEILVVTP